jgi:amino acid permease
LETSSYICNIDKNNKHRYQAFHSKLNNNVNIHKKYQYQKPMNFELMQLHDSKFSFENNPSANINVKVEKKSSLTSSTINLMKNTAGAGVFSLSGKLLSIKSEPVNSLVPRAVILILLLATWAIYNFYTIIETCRLLNANSYDDCWGKSISMKSKWIIQGVVSFAPFIGIIANTIVLTDIFTSVLQSIGGYFAMIANARNYVTILLCTLIIYPLCSLKDLSAMKSTSLFGLIGNVVSMIALGIRAYDKSYLSGGLYAPAAAVVAAAISTTTTTTTSILPISAATGAIQLTTSIAKDSIVFQWAVFASLLSYCYVTHYNAPRYYIEIEDSSSKSILTMTSLAYLGAAIIYIGSMTLGISAFGPNVKSYLLNNFASNDPLGIISRIAIGTSILTNTPLMFIALRNRLVDMARTKIPVIADIKRMAALLVLIVGLITTRLTGISVLASIAGGILGVNMMFTLPTIMYLSALQKKAKQNDTKLSSLTIIIHVLMIVAGLSLSAIGTSYSIANLFR